MPQHRSTVPLSAALLATLLLIVPRGPGVVAQYNSPESVTYDAAGQRHIISNAGSGQLLQRSLTGTVAAFASGLTQPKGLVIAGGVVYVADVTTVRGYALSNAANVFTVAIPGSSFLNDIEAAGGDLYISDTQTNSIYKINIATQAVSTFVSSGIQSPNGLLYDAANNRLLLVSFRANSPVQAIAMPSAAVTTVANTSLSNLDGITTDGQGNYFLSNWGSNQIHYFNSTFTNTPAVVAGGFNGPADIYYNQATDTLAIPAMNASQVAFLNMARTLTTNALTTTTHCAGASFTLTYTASGFFAGNVFTAQLSHASGGFAAPVTIGATTATGSGTISVTIPANTPAGSGYRIRVAASAPTTNGTDNGADLTIISGNPTSLTWTGAVNTLWSTIGNWNHPCAVPTLHDTVIIPPSTAPPTAIPSISLSRLALDNATGITLTNDMQITKSLELTGGNITLGSASLTIGPAGEIIGGNAGSFIITNGTGELRQSNIGSTGRTDTVKFPVGVNASRYAPLWLKNTGTSDEFRVRVSNGVLQNGSSGSPLPANIVMQTWHIGEIAAGGSVAELAVEWNASDEQPSFLRGSSFIARYDGTSWNPTQNAGPATGAGPYRRSVSGITAFSPFAVGDSLSSLPVELVSFTAGWLDGRVSLRWTTAAETSCEGFTLQRSRRPGDGYEALQFVPAGRTGHESRTYSVEDAPGEGGIWYYRLLIADWDGSTSYSPALEVSAVAVADKIAIHDLFPNPLSRSLGQPAHIRFSASDGGDCIVTMHEFTGRRVRELRHQPSGKSSNHIVSIPLADIPAGTYYVQVRQGASTARRILVIKQ